MGDYALSQLSVKAAPAALTDYIPLLDTLDTTTAPAGPAGSDKRATIASVIAGGYSTAEPLASGESLFPRYLRYTDIQATAGIMQLTAWTALTPDSACNTVSVATASIAAAGLTYANVAVYSIDANGNGTHLAETGDIHASNPFTSTFNGYTLNLSSSFNRKPGQRYAIGTIIAATTMPSFNAVFGADNFALPWLAAQITAASPPASFTYAGLSYGGMVLVASVAP